MRDKYYELFLELDIYFAEHPKATKVTFKKLDDMRYNVTTVNEEEV